MIDTQGYRPETVETWQRIPLDAAVPLVDAVRENRLIAIESRRRARDSLPDDGRRTSSSKPAPGSPCHSAREARSSAWRDSRSPTRGPSHAAEVEFVESLARQSGQALERALLLAAEYAARTRAEDMVVLTSALSQAVSPADVVNAIGAQILAARRYRRRGRLPRERRVEPRSRRRLRATSSAPARWASDGSPSTATSLPAEVARVRVRRCGSSFRRLGAVRRRRALERDARTTQCRSGTARRRSQPARGSRSSARRKPRSGRRHASSSSSSHATAAQPLERAWLMEREQHRADRGRARLGAHPPTSVRDTGARGCCHTPEGRPGSSFGKHWLH